MNKKDQESIIKRSMNRTISAFKRVILGKEINHAVNEIKSEIEDTIDDARKTIDKGFEKLTIHLMIFFFILTGLVFLFIGLSYFFMENLGFSESTAFLIVGTIILSMGCVFLDKVKNYNDLRKHK